MTIDGTTWAVRHQGAGVDTVWHLTALIIGVSDHLTTCLQWRESWASVFACYMSGHAILTGTDLVTTILKSFTLLVRNSIVDTEGWGWSDVWLWGGVDSRFGARCENREWCWVAAVWFFATGVGRIIHHHTSYWQVGISWTDFSADISPCCSILTFTIVVASISPFLSLAVGFALVNAHIWLRSGWQEGPLSGLYSWDRGHTGGWEHVGRVGASWVWRWVWVGLCCRVQVRVRIGVGVGSWRVVGGRGGGWVSSCDAASHSRWLVWISLVTLWDLATFGVIWIWDHDAAWSNIGILSTS